MRRAAKRARCSAAASPRRSSCSHTDAAVSRITWTGTSDPGRPAIDGAQALVPGDDLLPGPDQEIAAQLAVDPQSDLGREGSLPLLLHVPQPPLLGRQPANPG